MSNERQEQALIGLDGLVAEGVLAKEQAPSLRAIEARYAVRMPRGIAQRIKQGGAIGAMLAKQYVPSLAEGYQDKDEEDDPTYDEAYSPVKGVVHRYPDRVLLKPLAVCPVYCRFCFRRARIGPKEPMLSPDDLQQAYAYIRSHKEIFDVILTGGDPLMLGLRRLEEIITSLSSIEHIGVIRVHSRVLMAEPARMTDGMMAVFSACAKPLYLVVHCNHPAEVTQEVRVACQRVRRTGVIVLGQSVLLKGINDDPTTLVQLWRGMVAAGIKPYALHHLDRAPGTAHFRVGLKRGLALVEQARAGLSGLCVPPFMVEIPRGGGKVALQVSNYRQDKDAWWLQDAQGDWHAYVDSCGDSCGES
ncbi:MAG: KamA family radical SAM protein [Alphaproteobacteria bacterium GM202ARS2]|nr:KamA family radical SAM protein [Alphaproteobacteria bacterium GM202ARS2]